MVPENLVVCSIQCSTKMCVSVTSFICDDILLLLPLFVNLLQFYFLYFLSLLGAVLPGFEG